MSNRDSWTWPKRPTTEVEFNAMMMALDQHLAVKGLRPAQRAFNATRLISMAFKFSAPILGGRGPRGEPFGPTDLMARVFEWYDATFGERNKIEFSPGSTVMVLRGTYWRIRMPFIQGSFDVVISRNLQFGAVDGVASNTPEPINALQSVEDLTQAYANSLTDEELIYIFNEVAGGYHAVMALESLRGHALFDQARGDYRHSVEALLAGHHLSKARWDNAQCAEKVLKGLLSRAGHSYPTKGASGHDILELGRLVNKNLGVNIPEGCLRSIHCPTIVRYGEMNVDQNEAYTSHKDLLTMLRILDPAAFES